MIDNTINDDKTIAATRTCFAPNAIASFGSLGRAAWGRYGWRKIGNLTTRYNSKHDENESKS